MDVDLLCANVQGRFSRANVQDGLSYFSQTKWHKIISSDLFNPY